MPHFFKETLINLRNLSHFYFFLPHGIASWGDKSLRLAEPENMSISKALGLYCPISIQKVPSDPLSNQHFRRTPILSLLSALNMTVEFF